MEEDFEPIVSEATGAMAGITDDVMPKPEKAKKCIIKGEEKQQKKNKRNGFDVGKIQNKSKPYKLTGQWRARSAHPVCIQLPRLTPQRQAMLSPTL